MPHEIILLVDDEHADRGFMRDILHREGYEVLEGMDYSSAWTVFRANAGRISLLVTDVSLPAANGCELFKALAEEDPNLRVLFVSGHVGSEVCRSYGVAITDLYFLRKPFEPSQLVSRVREILDMPRPVPASLVSGA